MRTKREPKPYEPLPGYVLVTTADQVTDEVTDAARGICDGWFNDGPIDWDSVWERLDGTTLADGQRIDLGPEMHSPAMQRIQRTIRKERRDS